MLTLSKLEEIKMLIWNEQPRRVIAKEMGDESKTAVTNLIDRAVDRMKKSAVTDSDTKKNKKVYIKRDP